MAQIRWSLRANQDLRAILDFHQRTSPDRAASILASVIRSVEPLVEFPYLGRSVPESVMGGLREVLADPYRVLYRVTEALDVEIAAVYHSRRDLRRILRDNPWQII